MKPLKYFLLISLIVVLVACGTDNDSNNSVETDGSSSVATFTAEIIEIYEDLGSDTFAANVKVIDKENSGLTADTQLAVNLNVNADETFEIGDHIRVGFDGVIMESDPPQIRTESVEKLTHQ